MNDAVVSSRICDLMHKLFLTNQELLNSGQKKQSPTRSSVPSDGIVVPFTIKEFARENFR